MRSLPSALLTFLQSRAGAKSRVLVWVDAIDPATNAAVSMGLWNGKIDQVFTIDGVDRSYYGVGAVLKVPAVTYSSDSSSVWKQKINLSGINTAVKELLIGYNARFATIELHRAIYEGDTGVLVAEPQLMFRGLIDTVKFNRPKPGSGISTAVATVRSWLSKLTLVLSAKRSDATQQLNSGDRIRRYIDVTGTVGVWWGVKRS